MMKMNHKNGRTLADRCTVVERVTDSDECSAGAQPNIALLHDGTLLCRYPLSNMEGDGESRKRRTIGMRLAVSHDRGVTWQTKQQTDHLMGIMFEHEKNVYQLGNPVDRNGLFIRRSDDSGTTWSAPVPLADGRFYNQAAGYVRKPEKIYCAFGVPAPDGGRWKGSIAVAGDLSGDPMSPKAWRFSDPLQYPGTPPGISRALSPIQEDQMLEPNVVERQGKLFVLHRTKIDRYNISGLCAIGDLEDDGERLWYRFGQFHPMPGAQHKFHIFYDAPSRLYWNLANLPAQPPYLSLNGRQERRILVLLYSLDTLNWFQAGCVAMCKSWRESTGFGHAAVAGDDLLVVANGITQPGRALFDADTIMCYRIKNFREPALDIFPASD